MSIYNCNILPDISKWRIELHTPELDAFSTIKTIQLETFTTLVGHSVEQELYIFTDHKTGFVKLNRIPVKILDNDISYIVLEYRGYYAS